LHDHVVDALRAVRTASHESDVIGLLSAAEAFRAAREDRPESLAAVRTRYEQEVRPSDPTLGSWDDVFSGASMARAQHAVDELRAGPGHA